ncbi:hypothetical protein HRbin28_01554 [bacterium HR28]|nr:hypothetical protein HRbin28_01554 [bacterium HR28]
MFYEQGTSDAPQAVSLNCLTHPWVWTSAPVATKSSKSRRKGEIGAQDLEPKAGSAPIPGMSAEQAGANGWNDGRICTRRCASSPPSDPVTSCRGAGAPSSRLLRETGGKGSKAQQCGA